MSEQHGVIPGGTVTKVSATFRRSYGDDRIGWITAEQTVEVAVGEPAKWQAALDAAAGLVEEGVDGWVKEKVRQAKAKADAQTPPGLPQERSGAPPSVQPPAPRPSPETAPPAPVAPPSAPAAAVEIWDNPTIMHYMSENGQDRCKVLGGKWLKFGAPVYEEIADPSYPNWRSWPVGEKYPLPAPFTKVRVAMNEKGKPEKVTEFLR